MGWRGGWIWTGAAGEKELGEPKIQKRDGDFFPSQQRDSQIGTGEETVRWSWANGPNTQVPAGPRGVIRCFGLVVAPRQSALAGERGVVGPLLCLAALSDLICLYICS